jgi:hypothetical protein
MQWTFIAAMSRQAHPLFMAVMCAAHGVYAFPRLLQVARFCAIEKKLGGPGFFHLRTKANPKHLNELDWTDRRRSISLS